MSLSLVAEYDELVRCTNVLTDGSCEPEFFRFANSVHDMYKKWVSSMDECQRLQRELQTANKTISDVEQKLHSARRMVDSELRRRNALETRLREVENQMTLVRELVWDGRNTLHDDTRQRLASVCSRPCYPVRGNQEHEGVMSTISEAMNSTGSLLSEIGGYSMSDNDLDLSLPRISGVWRKHRRSNALDEPSRPKRARSTSAPREDHQGTSKTNLNNVQVPSGEGVVATTTITMPREGPVTAKSTIETLPSQDKLWNAQDVARAPLAVIQETAAPRSSTNGSEESLICGPEVGENAGGPIHCVSGMNLLARDLINKRAHTFVNKTIIRPEVCEPCQKKIKFGKIANKCQDCGATSHLDCKDHLPLPCVPVASTPTRRGHMCTIADYTSTVPPMVPALIVHCVNDVESRGLSEIGIYRVPGAEREVKALKEKFLRGRGVPNLSGYDVHVVCGVIKDFLRSLREPLVTPSSWVDFNHCLDPKEEADRQGRLYQAVSQLPQPNRDTLAYLVLHLQRVSECAACKMPTENLSKIFGPTLVGYSTPNPEPSIMVKETRMQAKVVELMMNTPSDYWLSFVRKLPGGPIGKTATPELQGVGPMQRTGFFSTPTLLGRSVKTRKKFFEFPQ